MACYSFWGSMNPFSDNPNDESAYPEPAANRAAQAVFLAKNPDAREIFFSLDRCTRLMTLEKAIEYINSGKTGISLDHHTKILLWAKAYQPNLLKEAEKGTALSNANFWTQGGGTVAATVAKTLNTDTLRNLEKNYDAAGKAVGEFAEKVGGGMSKLLMYGAALAVVLVYINANGGKRGK